jgi:hypothetical protein
MVAGEGSGSWHFYHSPSRCQPKKTFCLKNFFAYYILQEHLRHFQRKKCQKKSQISSNQCFSSRFCMIIAGAGSGSIPLTNGSRSGSRRPKNMCNRWIQIRIRIHNTVCNILCMIHPIQIRIRIKKKSDPDWHQHIVNLKHFNDRNSDDVRIITNNI